MKTPETTMNIFQTINAIMNDVGAIEKSQHNAQQNFKYRGIDMFINELHPLMAKHGLLICPEVLESERLIHETKSGAKQISSMLKIKYTMYALDGSSLASTYYAEAMDTTDKGYGKAMTSGLKSFLTTTFMVHTKDQEDIDGINPASIIGDLKPMSIPAVEFTDIISDEIYSCSTKLELSKVWDKYPHLKENPDFYTAVKDHGQVITADFYESTVDKPVVAKVVTQVPPPVKTIPESLADRRAKAAKAIGGNRV